MSSAKFQLFCSVFDVLINPVLNEKWTLKSFEVIDLANFSGIKISELWSVSYVTHSIQGHFVRIDISIVNFFLMLFLCYFIFAYCVYMNYGTIHVW